MAIRLLPNESVQFVSELAPAALLERLRERTEEVAFLPWGTPADMVFQGKIEDDGTFELRLLQNRSERLNPVIRGSIVEWQGGSAVSARVSLNWPLALQAIVYLLLYVLIGGPEQSLLVQIIGISSFVVLLHMNRRGVLLAAGTFRQEMARLTEHMA